MFSNLSVSRALAQGELVIAVDAARLPADPFKLSAPLLALIQADITALEAGDSDTHEAEGRRAGASATVREAFDKLEAALRIGLTGIGAIVGEALLPTGISDADRLAVHTTYGWENGLLDSIVDDRLLVLGELALQGENTIANAAWRYSTSLVHIIGDQLDIIETGGADATDGHRQITVAGRLDQRDLLQTHLSRARYHYCAASDDLDATKELAKISFQPRRQRPDSQ